MGSLTPQPHGRGTARRQAHETPHPQPHGTAYRQSRGTAYRQSRGTANPQAHGTAYPETRGAASPDARGRLQLKARGAVGPKRGEGRLDPVRRLRPARGTLLRLGAAAVLLVTAAVVSWSPPRPCAGVAAGPQGSPTS